LIDRSRLTDQTHVELAVFDFIEGFYNTKRRHSGIGNLSPTNFEANALRVRTVAAPRTDTPSSILPLKEEEARRLARVAASLHIVPAVPISSKPRRYARSSTPNY
jgi:hypothetical protein